MDIDVNGGAESHVFSYRAIATDHGLHHWHHHIVVSKRPSLVQITKNSIKIIGAMTELSHLPVDNEQFVRVV